MNNTSILSDDLTITITAMSMQENCWRGEYRICKNGDLKHIIKSPKIRIKQIDALLDAAEMVNTALSRRKNLER